MKQVSSGWLHSPLPTSLKVLRVVYEHDLRQRVPNYCERVHEQVELAAVDDAVVVPPPAVPVVGLRQKRGGGGGEVGPRVSTFEGSQGLPRARGSALSRALKGSPGLEGQHFRGLSRAPKGSRVGVILRAKRCIAHSEIASRRAQHTPACGSRV